MPALRELQHTMLAAILGGEPAQAAALLGPGLLGPRHRLAVYANNARANFLASLASGYPVVQRLVGEDFFKQTVQRFQQQSPSRCGDLLPAGAGFADFLRNSLGPEFAYLPEVARLEWLVQESALAADAPPFDVRRLAALPVADYDALHFRLHPAARLFASSFPCIDIWQANVDTNREPAVISLDDAPCSVVIGRTRGDRVFHGLSHGEQRLLAAFANDAPFAAAVEAALADPAFDAAAALARFVRHAVIVDFT